MYPLNQVDVEVKFQLIPVVLGEEQQIRKRESRDLIPTLWLIPNQDSLISHTFKRREFNNQFFSIKVTQLHQRNSGLL
jgi:hypothetical protein